jgi:cytochrome c553
MKKIALIALLTSTALMAGKPASYNACIGCHGINGEKNTMAPASKPNTMTKAEIVTALKGYKAGTLNKYGKGAMMRGFASRLSDAQMQEIANYIGK